MNYLGLPRNGLRIPTIVGLLVICIGIAVAVFLIGNSTNPFSQATGTTTPKNVLVTNVSDTSFSVNWMTDTIQSGSVIYREPGLFSKYKTVMDIRDNGRQQQRFIHLVTVTGLKPQTIYNITLVSGSKIYSDLSAVTTGPVLAAPNHQVNPAFGSLSDSSNQTPEETLVFASFPGSQTLSSLAQNGNWLIPLGNLRTSDLTKYFLPSPKDTEQLQLINQTAATTVTTNIENDSPVPTVIMGRNYDFTKTGKRYLPVIAAAENFGKISGTVNTVFAVIRPREGDVISTDKPAFQGTGTPEKQVLITVNQTGSNTPVTVKVKISSNGQWQWTPEKGLEAGNYLATFASVDANSKTQVKSVSFKLLKSGSSVLADATPSGSLKPTPVATTKALPRPSATVAPRITPPASATQSGVPTTGNDLPTLAFLFIGLGILAIGGLGISYKRI